MGAFHGQRCENGGEKKGKEREIGTQKVDEKNRHEYEEGNK
jgi:hypothetical protein